MIPKSGIFGPGASSAPGGVDVGPEQPSLPMADEQQDFSSLMSNAFRDPARQNFSQNANAPASAQPGPDAIREQGERDALVQGNDEAQQASSDVDGADDKTDSSSAKNSSSEPAKKSTDTDASVTSTLLAMMAQFGVTPVELQKLSLGDGQKLKVVAADEKSAAQALTAGEQKAGDAAAAKSGDTTGSPASLKELMSVLKPVPPEAPEHAHSQAKTAPTTLKVNPADISPAVDGVKDIKGGESESPQQQIVEKYFLPQVIAQSNALARDGTDGASNGQRMRLSDEKNEISGAAGQKVPQARSVASITPDASATVTVDADGAGSHKGLFDSGLSMDFTGKPFSMELDTVPSAGTTQAADGAVQVERVAQMVNQEIVVLRQSGANSLAVSLKVDAHTELFLQLTNHGGQMQASLRVERGSGAGLDSHWADLQNSLARQNVQLMPLEVKATANTSAFNSNLFSQSQSQSQTQQQDAQRQPRELPQEAPVATPVKNNSSAKAKTKTAAAQGWETWA